MIPMKPIQEVGSINEAIAELKRMQEEMLRIPVGSKKFRLSIAQIVAAKRRILEAEKALSFTSRTTGNYP